MNPIKPDQASVTVLHRQCPSSVSQHLWMLQTYFLRYPRDNFADVKDSFECTLCNFPLSQFALHYYTELKRRKTKRGAQILFLAKHLSTWWAHTYSSCFCFLSSPHTRVCALFLLSNSKLHRYAHFPRCPYTRSACLTLSELFNSTCVEELFSPNSWLGEQRSAGQCPSATNAWNSIRETAACPMQGRQPPHDPPHSVRAGRGGSCCH